MAQPAVKVAVVYAGLDETSDCYYTRVPVVGDLVMRPGRRGWTKVVEVHLADLADPANTGYAAYVETD